MRLILCGFLFTIVALIPTRAHAEDGIAMVFLTLPDGARSGAMGSAFVAVADDALGMFVNPAGIAPDFDAKAAFPWPCELTSTDRQRWMPVLDLDDMWLQSRGGYVGISESGAIGMSHKRLNVGEAYDLDVESNELKTFNVFDEAYGITGAMRVHPQLKVGAALKYIHSQLHPDDGTCNTWAVDFGMFYHLRPFASSDLLVVPGLSVGVSLANLGPDVRYDRSTTHNPLPRLIRVGFAQEVQCTRVARILLSAEFDKIMVNWHEDSLGDELRESTRRIGVEGELRIPLNTAELRMGISLFGRLGYYYDYEIGNEPEGRTEGYGIGFDAILSSGGPGLLMRVDFGTQEPPDYLGDADSEFASATLSIVPRIWDNRRSPNH